MLDDLKNVPEHLKQRNVFAQAIGFIDQESDSGKSFALQLCQAGFEIIHHKSVRTFKAVDASLMAGEHVGNLHHRFFKASWLPSVNHPQEFGVNCSLYTAPTSCFSHGKGQRLIQIVPEPPK